MYSFANNFYSVENGDILKSEVLPDSIVVGGPTNSLIRHGPSNRRGFGPEKKIGGEGGGERRREYQAGVPSDRTVKIKYD